MPEHYTRGGITQRLIIGKGAMVINVEDISEQLRNDPDTIIKVLIQLGFPEDKIKYHASNNMITSTRPDPEADNTCGFMLYCGSLFWKYNTRNGKGNIYTLVMDLKHVSFPQALKLVAKWIGCDINNNIRIKLPFDGFYKNFIPKKDEQLDTELNVYDNELLPPPACNLRFKKDGISYNTQQIFDLRFDLDNNSILIPIYNTNHELVGCKARKNENVTSNKYWAELSFPKSSVVYGLSQNYKSIVSKRKVIIFEAEKSVMQCYDFGCTIAVAVMGHDISKVQARIIKSLMCDEIIIAFDEGVPEEDIKQAASMVYLKNYNKVSYLYGGLPKGSKKSPSDLGKDQFKKLVQYQKKTFKGD